MINLMKENPDLIDNLKRSIEYNLSELGMTEEQCNKVVQDKFKHMGNQEEYYEMLSFIVESDNKTLIFTGDSEILSDKNIFYIKNPSTDTSDWYFLLETKQADKVYSTVPLLTKSTHVLLRIMTDSNNSIHRICKITDPQLDCCDKRIEILARHQVGGTGTDYLSILERASELYLQVRYGIPAENIKIVGGNLSVTGRLLLKCKLLEQVEKGKYTLPGNIKKGPITTDFTKILALEEDIHHSITKKIFLSKPLKNVLCKMVGYKSGGILATTLCSKTYNQMKLSPYCSDVLRRCLPRPSEVTLEFVHELGYEFTQETVTFQGITIHYYDIEYGKDEHICVISEIMCDKPDNDVHIYTPSAIYKAEILDSLTIRDVNILELKDNIFSDLFKFTKIIKEDVPLNENDSMSNFLYRIWEHSYDRSDLVITDLVDNGKTLELNKIEFKRSFIRMMLGEITGSEIQGIIRRENIKFISNSYTQTLLELFKQEDELPTTVTEANITVTTNGITHQLSITDVPNKGKILTYLGPEDYIKSNKFIDFVDFREKDINYRTIIEEQESLNCSHYDGIYGQGSVKVRVKHQNDTETVIDLDRLSTKLLLERQAYDSKFGNMEHLMDTLDSIPSGEKTHVYVPTYHSPREVVINETEHSDRFVTIIRSRNKGVVIISIKIKTYDTYAHKLFT